MLKKRKKADPQLEMMAEILRLQKKLNFQAKWRLILGGLLSAFLLGLIVFGLRRDDANKQVAEIKVANIASSYQAEAIFADAKAIGESGYEVMPLLYLPPLKSGKRNLAKLNWDYVHNFLIRNISTGRETLLVHEAAYLNNFGLNSWYWQWQQPEMGKPSYFYYVERSKDTNHDGKINSRDEGQAYAYRLKDGKIVALNPPGTTFNSICRIGRGPILQMKIFRKGENGAQGHYEFLAWDQEEPSAMKPVAGPEIAKELKEDWKAKD